ncbi:hypothetical protein [Flavobacterium sp.]|jgi:hypothetical protein|uniref:hypothetical protein n=1 Tax=Flavobacterium sp. TaxID=239 RepID=UPI0037BF3449
MKNIIKTIFFAFLIITISSCENDKVTAVANGFELRKDSSVSTPTILTESLNTSTFTKLEWDKSNNGVTTASNYKLVIFDHDNDPNLEDGIEYVTSNLIENPSSLNSTINVKEFNDLINLLPKFKCSQMKIDIRIKSTLGLGDVNPLVQYSNPITYSVTGYPKSLPLLAFVKDVNSTNVSTEPKLAASAAGVNTNYEGYMFLQPGSYKFYKPDACGDFTGAPAYGGATGTINTDASAPSIVVTTAGHYIVKANLALNTYSLSQFTTFGVFGLATRATLSGNQVPMDYDAPNKIWKLTVDLRKGYKFKFKSNLWTGALVVPALPNPPYAPGTATSAVSILGKIVDGQLEENSVAASGEITVPGSATDNTRQKYYIELNVSNPRKYTYKMTAVN